MDKIQHGDLVKRLQDTVRNIRRKPTPIADIIPLLNDAIALLTAPAEAPPIEAITKINDDLMAHYVSNGANSISMPDECVEVAAWLQGIPVAPLHQSAPVSREAVIEECAKVCERQDGVHDAIYAAAIRTLAAHPAEPAGKGDQHG